MHVIKRVFKNSVSNLPAPVSVARAMGEQVQQVLRALEDATNDEELISYEGSSAGVERWLIDINNFKTTSTMQ